MAQTRRWSESAELWCLDVLLVEPDEEAREAASGLLRSVGHRVHAVACPMEALALARTHPLDLLIADVDSPVMDGFSLMTQVRGVCPGAHAMLCSQAPSIEDAVSATKARADYLIKPLVSKNLLGPVAIVARARERREEHLAACERGQVVIGKSPLVKSLLRDAKIVAGAEGPVLISGERGTGKSLLARRLHALGERAELPLVEVDCSAGECGVIFGAGGPVALAAGGTLLFEGVEALAPAAQTALLELIDVRRRGTDSPRVIAITTVDLAHTEGVNPELARALAELHLRVPPLRARRDDLPALVDYFCFKAVSDGKGVPRIAPEVWALLAAEPFPGNVAELETTVRHALTFHDGGDLRLEHLPAELRSRWLTSVEPGDNSEQPVAPLNHAVDAFEHQYLRQALVVTAGNRTRAASLLGISRKSLWAKLKRFERRPPSLHVEWRR